jgi:hypothetical protein
MYDIYQSGNTFPVGANRLPKHKGFVMFGGATAIPFGFTAYILNDQGNTISMNFNLDAGPNYYPNKFYAIAAMTAGVTGMMLN